MATSKGVVKSRVLFDYTKPELHGYLYKQGALHKAFKKRYFVLYPGYLVYYTDETKYKSDVAKGSLQVCSVKSSDVLSSKVHDELFGHVYAWLL